MSENLKIYEAVKTVPDNALKPILAGRLKGKSDINPMWRIETLTEQFGVCGFGWKYKIIGKRLEQGGNGEISAFVDIELYIKMNNEWSEPIPGTGGSSFVSNEKNGLYTNDECFKMALTDAISVSCKALGVGASVYWNKDTTKYNKPTEQKNKQDTDSSKSLISEPQAKRLYALAKGNAEIVRTICTKYGYTSSKDISTHDYNDIASEIEFEAKKASGQ